MSNPGLRCPASTTLPIVLDARWYLYLGCRSGMLLYLEDGAGGLLGFIPAL